MSLRSKDAGGAPVLLGFQEKGTARQSETLPTELLGLGASAAPYISVPSHLEQG